MDIAQDAPDTVILAEDQASLDLQATQQRAWAPRGQTPTVRVDTGRANTHLYGALNLHSGHEVVMNSPVMTAVATILFLQLVLRTYPDRPTHVCRWCNFPPGCPDLNPQEHVWKDARGAVSHTHAFTKLGPLLDAFMAHLRTKRFTCFLLPNMNFEALAGFAIALRI